MDKNVAMAKKKKGPISIYDESERHGGESKVQDTFTMDAIRCTRTFRTTRWIRISSKTTFTTKADDTMKDGKKHEDP